MNNDDMINLLKDVLPELKTASLTYKTLGKQDEKDNVDTMISKVSKIIDDDATQKSNQQQQSQKNGALRKQIRTGLNR